MTNNYLVESLNTGLNRILKDIANTYPNVDFKELSDKYLIRASSKKAKRKGHVSSYNIFLKETRPSIVAKDPNLSFAEIAARVSKLWDVAKKDGARMAELEAKKHHYVQLQMEPGLPVVPPVVVAPVVVPVVEPVVPEVAEPVAQKKKKGKKAV